MSTKSDPSANIESVYPLSPMQEGMLFHTLLAPGSGIYLMQNRYRIEGPVRGAEFEAAFRAVVARHPILRTSFVWKTQRRPLQVVHKEVELPFINCDLSALNASAQESRIVTDLSAELSSGLDFGKAPLMCFRLYQLGEQQYELVHSFHHILLDEWCTSLLMMDFTHHYEALVAGQTLTLPAARPYRDYIGWLQRQDQARTEAFWRRYLEGFSSPTSLGIELMPATADGTDTEDLACALDAHSTAILTQLAQQHRLTLNTLVQGAWALLLSRYSGEPEVVFGVTVAGRPPDLPEVDTILGLFINTLPLRVPVPLEARLVPWLVGLQAQNLELRQYEHTPLVDVQRWSGIDRGQSLFQSLFVFENAPIDPALRAGRSFRVTGVHDRVHTNYPVTVMGWPDRELGLKISYDKERVSQAAAERMLEQLRNLLAAMAARPEARLGEFRMLSGAERERALNDWNATPPGDQRLDSLAARFLQQVQRTPRAVAARCEGKSITYAELNRAANRVAQALRARGVGPETRVALIDDRGLGLLTMMLAVFKAGGAYVPIETTYPSARIREIVHRSTPRVVLTQASLQARIADALGADAQPLVLSFEEASLASDAELTDGGDRQSLAYVIYTSGSTGAPKGAMVERAGMLNNMLSKLPRLGFEPGDVIAQTASQCFDISVWQHFTALLHGGTVEIIPDEVVREPARLLDRLERAQVTVVELVPALLQGLLDAVAERGDADAALACLRWVLPTGEALPVGLARAWLLRFPRIGLMNAYGPAECSDDVALHPITTLQQLDAPVVPIGRPVDQLRLYVLDRTLEPLPVDVTGELYVGGLGVGRGYLGDARRTAEAFLPDPFSRAAGARIYRTGDLARYRSDGCLEFVGRRDSQVKLRGLRIELGEIEARLTEHSEVREGAVQVREDRPGAKQLVAYAVTPISEDELRDFLRARLPECMVPARFVLLSALPRTANGKIDRKSLPAPELDASSFVAPRDEHEQKLAAIWREVLGVERLSVEESFYALGGHSLQLTQVLSRVRRVFDVEVPLRSLFEAPTVGMQARVISAAQRTACADSARPALVRVQNADRPPLSFAQERLWFLAQLEPSAAAYNVPVAVRLSGPLDVARLRDCLGLLSERHETLRVRFATDESGTHSRADAPACVLADPVDLSTGAEPETLARAALEREAARPFDLTRGPLMRLMLIRVGAAEHVLSIVLHHAVSDGWSLGVMVRELAELYTAQAERRAARLPTLPIRYSDYAHWQRAWLSSGALDRELAFWRDRLRGSVHSIALPLDRARPALRSYYGARHVFTLPPALQNGVLAMARQHFVTPYVVLLSAFQLLLARLSGQTRFLVGTPVANRTHEELESLIGFFVNTVVLRAELDGDPAFEQVVTSVREDWLGAQEHQELPFERLVQALRPERDLSQTPLFQVMFSLQERDARPTRVQDITLSSFEVDPKSAQFDLSLHMALDEEGLSGFFEYSTELFESASITRLGQAFHHLLEAALARPSLRLSELPFPAWPRCVLEATAPQPSAASAAAEAPSASVEALDAQLQRLWAETLGQPLVQPDDNFFGLGGDSILSLDLVARARRAGVRFSVRDLFQHQSPRALAQAIATRRATAEDEEQGPVTGPSPLLPIQRRFFKRELPNPHHWNQSLLLTTDQALEFSALTLAIQALVRHHDALRLRFIVEAGSAHAQHASDEQTLTHRADLSKLPADRRMQALAQHADRWQASLDLTAGPLLRAVLFEAGPGQPQHLLLVAHHLVIDGVSWRILLADLELAYDQAQRAQPIELAEKSSSFKRWAERLQRAADEPRFIAEAQTWLDLPLSQATALPLDDTTGDSSVAAVALHDEQLSEVETRALLDEVPRPYRNRVEEVLLAALALALHSHTGGSAHAIDLEAHGREPWEDEALDLSRTIGWFTAVYPVLLELPADYAPASVLVAIKEQLRKVPRHGLAYGVVRELGSSEVSERLRALPTPRIAFNYLGQWDAVVGDEARFRAADASAGSEQDPRSPLPYELEIDAAIYQGRLGTTFRFSGARLKPATVASIANAYSRELARLIAHCRAPEAGAYSPSDFPDVALSETELGAILEQVD